MFVYLSFLTIPRSSLSTPTPSTNHSIKPLKTFAESTKFPQNALEPGNRSREHFWEGFLRGAWACSAWGMGPRGGVSGAKARADKSMNKP